MSEITSKTLPSPFQAARPSLGVVSLLVLVAVIGMPVQAASFLGAPGSHAVGAPSTPAVLSTPTHSHGLTIAPSVLSSPLGIRNHALLNALVASASGQGLGPALAQLLPQTAAPAGATEPAAPQYSGGVNNYITNSDCQGWGSIQNPNGGQYIPTIAGSSIAQVGTSNQSLVAGGGSLITIFDPINTTGGAFCTSGTVGPQTTLTGYSNVFLSENGGASWSNLTVPQNTTHWQNPSDIANGSMTTGSDVVTAAPNGLALEITGYAQACISVPVAISCGSSLALAGPWGYGVTRSTDGGHTWSEVNQISQVFAFSYVLFPTACGFNPNPALVGNDIPEHPWISTNGTYAVATWDILHLIWDTANCTLGALQATVQESFSHDMGQTWSSPVNVTGPVSESPTVHFGPAPSSPIYILDADVSSANSSTSGQIQWQWAKSTDGGASWSTLKEIGKWTVNGTCFTCSVTPDAIDTTQTAFFAVDNWSTSPHSGNLYVAWQDNGTGGTTGQVVIDLERSANGGTSWSPTQQLTPASASLHYVEPAVTVSPDGTVWVTFYAFGTSSGYYNLYGVVSSDGGVTWSPTFLISSAASTPNSALQDIGYYMGGVGTTAGFVPIWSDCRSASCSGNDVQLYTANVHTLSITTNATSPINAQVTVFSSTSSYPLPLTTGLDNGVTVTVKVPQEIPYNATFVDSFTGWAGLSTSANFQTSFTFPGSGSLQAIYTPVPAAFISGTFSPNGAGASLTIDNAPVTLTPLNATAYSYTISVSSGQSYYLNASEPKYVGDNRLVGVAAGSTTWENFTLARQTGFLTGTLTPANGFLTLNSTTNESSAVNSVTGQFNLVVPWGWYWLNASLPGFTSSVCQGHEVQVVPGVATTCNFNLVGGWIYGTVNPAKAGLSIEIDGALVSNTFGVFNQSVAGGYHTLSATQPGYNLSVFSNIQVVPGRSTPVNVSLTNHGWIAGLIAPVAALKNLLLTVTSGSQGGPQVYDSTTGTYNVSVVGGLTWTVLVKSTGYNTTTAQVPVTAGNVSAYNVVLNLSTPVTNCTVNCGCTTDCNPGNASPSSGPGLLVYALALVVVLVLVAVVAMVMMMRRRGGGGGGGNYADQPPPPPDETYQGTSPSDLPKLQQDGSMGEGNPPQ